MERNRKHNAVIKQCSCGHHLTITADSIEGATIVGENELGIWYDCNACGSTGLLEVNELATVEDN